MGQLSVKNKDASQLDRKIATLRLIKEELESHPDIAQIIEDKLKAESESNFRIVLRFIIIFVILQAIFLLLMVLFIPK